MHYPYFLEYPNCEILIVMALVAPLVQLAPPKPQKWEQVMVLRALCISIIISMVGAVGCAEYRGLQRTDGVPRDLNIGDEIQVTLKDKQHFEFVVVDITDQSIVGDHIDIKFDEIRSIRKKEINKMKTTAAAGGGILVTAFVVLMILVSAALSG